MNKYKCPRCSKEVDDLCPWIPVSEWYGCSNFVCGECEVELSSKYGNAWRTPEQNAEVGFEYDPRHPEDAKPYP